MVGSNAGPSQVGDTTMPENRLGTATSPLRPAAEMRHAAQAAADPHGCRGATALPFARTKPSHCGSTAVTHACRKLAMYRRGHSWSSSGFEHGDLRTGTASGSFRTRFDPFYQKPYFVGIENGIYCSQICSKCRYDEDLSTSICLARNVQHLAIQILFVAHEHVQRRQKT